MFSFAVGMVAFIAFGTVFAIELRKAGDTIGNLPVVMQDLSRKPSVIVSADGKVLYSASSEYRKSIRYDELPKIVVDATLAAEDKRFFDHQGVDYWSIGRAVFTGGKKGGGSTLTMQIAKRVYTGAEKSFQRKIKDMALATMIEKKYTKEQILELYVNQVYYGSGAFGIEAAAEVYFGKTVKQLTIAEAALLSRLVRRPSDENPYKNLKAAINNRNVVLNIMRDENMITPTQYEKAIAEKPNLRKQSFGSGARILASPYFVEYVLDQLHHDFPDLDLKAGGYRIETTLNTSMDDYTQKAVRDLVHRFRRSKVTTAAFVLMNDDGQIKAMIGGLDYQRSQFNVIFQGHRQPGSAFKPLMYAAALSRGVIGPNDSISNAMYTWVDPSSGKVWRPKNNGGGYGGNYSVRSAIAFSKNVPAVRVCDMVGPENVVAYAHDVFGIQSHLNPVLSIALGTSEVTPLEMAEAYSVFLLGGNRVNPYAITRIIGPDGEVVRQYEPVIQQGVLDPQVCGWMDSFLRAVVTSGTAKKASVVEEARGKTGTTQENKDAWFCGYTNHLIGIGWIANETFDAKRNPPWVYETMPAVTGGKVTVELWVDVMQKALDKFGNSERKFAVSNKRHHDENSDESQDTIIAPEDQNPVDNVNPDNQEMPSGQKPEPENKPPKQDGHPTESGGEEPTPSNDIPKSRDNGGTSPAPEDAPVEEQGATVSVEVCAETGMRATEYCPETVTRRFPRGRQPKRFCSKHRG